jgi:segregation and condensation protein B
MENLKHIVESLLFVTDDPLSVDKIKNALGIAEAAPVREALRELAEEYEARGGGFYLNQVAGGYQLRTRPEYREWIKRLVQPKAHRLSRAALETLAIVAYKQPIIRSDIEHIRGVDSGGILRTLLERKLIRVMGRREIPGRPLIYGTTKLFLEVFGLKSLQDLPTPKEIEEFEEKPLADNLPPGEAAGDTTEGEEPAPQAQPEPEAETSGDTGTSEENLSEPDNQVPEAPREHPEPPGEPEPPGDAGNEEKTPPEPERQSPEPPEPGAEPKKNLDGTDPTPL